MTAHTVIHVSDLHVTDDRRLPDVADYLNRIACDVEARRPPHLVIVAGDLYGHAVPHRSTPRERAVLYPWLTRMADLAPVVVVPGNHDHQVDLEGLEHLGGRYQIRVARGAEVIKVPGAGRASINVLALPYPTKRWLIANQGDVRGVAATQAAVEARLGQLLKAWSLRVVGGRRRSPEDAWVLAAHVQVGGSRTAGGEVLSGQEVELARGDLEGLGVDYGALGHLHLRQEPARRCWYPSSPWRNDFGETDRDKGYHVVEIGGTPSELGVEHDDHRVDYPAEPGGAQSVRVTFSGTDCRRFLTLDYRWAADDDGEPAWVERPTIPDAELAEAEVRARLVVPQQWVGGCPWAAELERLEGLAHHVVAERVIEPRHRVRAPEVAAGRTVADKVRAYWSTLATQPTASEAAAALACLAELDQHDDEQIEAFNLSAGELTDPDDDDDPQTSESNTTAADTGDPHAD